MIVKVIKTPRYTASIDDEYVKKGKELEDYLKLKNIRKVDTKDEVTGSVSGS